MSIAVKKVLIANRGAIAVRIIRTLKRMGIVSVAVYATADRDSLHVRMADETICLGEGAAKDTYLNQHKIFEAISKTKAQAVHPGYGFLSENPDFVRACEQKGIIFLGPTARQIEMFGLKHTARSLAKQNNIPLLDGTELLSDIEQAKQAANHITYPVILKSTAGGGGIGMQICENEAQLVACFESVKRLGENNFSNAGVFLEKFIARARHIEVQVFGDGAGEVLAFGERDCSSQRRNQKVIEEAPAPNLPQSVREALLASAIALCKSINYQSAGTVEFILDQKSNHFYFLEVNTRLQVEHGVTEEIFGIDIVALMVQLGFGELPSLENFSKLPAKGHAIQVRIYAEDPQKDFLPSAGLLTQVKLPETDSNAGVRVDHWIEAGLTISPYFDPMLGKLIVHADTRKQAIDKLIAQLNTVDIYGIETNVSYVAAILKETIFVQGNIYTRFLNDFSFCSPRIEVLSGGTFTTIQDYPARTGYWDVGVPPSGPFDSLACRLANQLVGNVERAAALECTLNGPTLLFNSETTIALTGAEMEAELDGKCLPFWQSVSVKPGQRLRLGKIKGAGARTYLAIAGGIDCPDYLGSKSTFTLGLFGGHAGRTLKAGDVLHLSNKTTNVKINKLVSVPEYSNVWNLHVIYGPHGAPDFFTKQDIDTFFSHEWQVHYNSSRTGIRLIGPKPEWARTDGGEAGMHPSNIHDNAYAIGTVDFTGDMPVILGPDGPSLGGFVCPATVIEADLWKLGQLKAGDKIRFVSVAIEEAVKASAFQNENLIQAKYHYLSLPEHRAVSPVIETIRADTEQEVDICFRPSGDCYVLIEFGPLQLDIELRFRAHALMLWLQENTVAGIEELTPGIRSLQIRYQPHIISLQQVIAQVKTGLKAQGDISNMTVPAREINLPLSWNDEACQLAIQKYMQSVRKDAPWCPSNIEFIRRINGLDSLDEVRRIVFDASYLVMGLGDVYLGAPVATPIDPRHRLVTTKYNPARTWTAENSVGIGGSYMCIYGMEGPGGYQFVGRTLQMWNRYHLTQEFDKPWLLEFFDQIRFYEVSAEELLKIREDFPRGNYPLKIKPIEFSLAQYRNFLNSHATDIEAFTQKRERAFDEELKRWVASGQINFSVEQLEQQASEQSVLQENEIAVESSVSGNVWELCVKEGQFVATGDALMIIESMKMEIAIEAQNAGRVKKILRQTGQSVSAGQWVVVMDTHDKGAH